MIRYLTHKDIDKNAWNSCLDASGTDLIYPYSWYLDVVCPKWEAIVVEDKGQYLYVLPVPWKRKLGLKYVYQPYFTQQLGIFKRDDVQNSHSEQEDAMLALLYKKYSWVEMCLERSVDSHHEKLTVEERKTYILNLDNDYSDIYRGYNTNRKRNLKRSKEVGVIIEEDNSIEQFISFFIDQKGEAITDMSSSDYTLLSRLYEHLIPNGKIKLFQATHSDHSTIAYGLFLFHHGRVVFLLGTANAEGRKVGVMTQLLDHVIAHYGPSMKKLDFEGSSIDSIAKFYASFGGIPEKFWYFKYNNLPFPYNRFKK